MDISKIMMGTFKLILNLYVAVFRGAWSLFKMLAKFVGVAVGWLFGKGVEAYRTPAINMKKISRKQKKEFRHFLDNAGLTEKVQMGDEFGTLYPALDIVDNKYVLGILDSQSPEQYEKHLRGLGVVFGVDFVALKPRQQFGYYDLIPQLLPSIVLPSDKPEQDNRGFWVGTDAYGEGVYIDFGESPSMLITGASGSGKSVLAVQLINEALAAEWEVFACDGKGGVDLKGLCPNPILTEFDEIREHYEDLLSEMKSRLKILQKAPNHIKNWRQYNEHAQEEGLELFEPILSFLDEASDFFVIGSKSQDKNYDNKHEIVKCISELCRKSRAVGIYQAISLQASAASSIPDDVKNNSAFRISYQLPTAAASQVLFESSIAFDSSLRQGKGVFKGVGAEPVIFRGAYCE